MAGEEDKIEVTLGSKEEVYWTDRRDECQRALDVLKKELKMNEAIFKMTEEKIEEAKAQREEEDKEDVQEDSS